MTVIKGGGPFNKMYMLAIADRDCWTCCDDELVMMVKEISVHNDPMNMAIPLANRFTCNPCKPMIMSFIALFCQLCTAQKLVHMFLFSMGS